MTKMQDPLDVAEARATRERMMSGVRVPLARLCASGSGVGPRLGTLLRYLVLRAGEGRISPDEFVKFGLADLPARQARAFVGRIAQAQMHATCNDPGWFATTKNKLLWETVLRGGGLPVPRTLAVYDRKGRSFGLPLLRDTGELERFLGAAGAPLFCKPVSGVYSIGSFRIDGFNGRMATVNGGWRKSAAELADYFEAVGRKGYLLQAPLAPHPSLAAFTGDAVSTIRFLLMIDGGEATLASAVLKLAGRGEVADNFWRPGAVLCALDADSGEVVRVVRRDGLAVAEETGEHTPLGMSVPDYRAALDLARRAALFFGPIRTQSWDVAVTDEGPVLMELNFGGDLSLGQMAHGRGLLDGPFRGHLERCGALVQR